MCAVAEVAVCQISFLPVDSEDYIEDIHRVLAVIESTDLEIDIGAISTLVKGNRDKVLKLIKDIYIAMENVCSFVMDIKLSNVCGCR
ncbi:MAG: YkoF family thiamine/hydroxymethylpyrimidine-binding protein [Bacillota bacterium]